MGLILTTKENSNCYSTMEVRRVCPEYTEYLVVLPCPMITVDEKLQKKDKFRRTINGSDSSEMKVWVTPLGKEP